MRNWTHHYARINDLQMHYVEEGRGPLVVLLHGFPHTWYSWRHQITALAEAGYRVVAPDLRGMGQTEAPEEPSAYRADVITADLCALLDHLGEEQAVFSGIDYGMFAAYDLAAEHPERVRGLIGLQYASLPHYDQLPSQTELERGKESFNHMAYYHADPHGARADYEAHPREIIAKIFHALSTDGDIGAVYANPAGTAYRDALPEPPALPWSWLTEWELEAYVSDFARSGFGGGINWYRVADLNWAYRNARGAKSTNVPYYFLGSETDLLLAEQYGAGIQAQLDANHKDVRAVQSVPGGGYLIAMERSAEVSAKFLEFLHDMHRVRV
ncbi:alpha/beta fold hydrolase [Paeniglutamicibacter gangotriensis]|uniref:Alpha/beta hydrolase n=1 Tax=Paeniglutamicibacter gangotriensis Lz1y TaxID=1276920 RepID=M7NEI2_9MICC|nr:alpha/beta fold hydrolase [Paeniglutamicibacter gangotriensis]EMR00210.1 alpha/beta hydrolase [Paeniglutamicibacter gangotriensis Lz1y]